MSTTTVPSSMPELLAPITWDGIATIVAATLGAVILLIGFIIERRRQRRARHAEAYAGALQAVSDYLEAPYRIRRRSGSGEDRFALSAHVSEIQSRLDFYTAHLALVAPSKIHQAYVALVTAAKSEAGSQMTEAWRTRPTKRDRDVPLTDRYAHPRADHARERALELMRTLE